MVVTRKQECFQVRLLHLPDILHCLLFITGVTYCVKVSAAVPANLNRTSQVAKQESAGAKAKPSTLQLLVETAPKKSSASGECMQLFCISD